MDELRTLRARVVQLSEILKQQAVINHMAHHHNGHGFDDCPKPACRNARAALADRYTAEPQALSEPTRDNRIAVVVQHPENVHQIGLHHVGTMPMAKGFAKQAQGEGWLAWPVVLRGDGRS